MSLAFAQAAALWGLLARIDQVHGFTLLQAPQRSCGWVSRPTTLSSSFYGDFENFEDEDEDDDEDEYDEIDEEALLHERINGGRLANGLEGFHGIVGSL